MFSFSSSFKGSLESSLHVASMTKSRIRKELSRALKQTPRRRGPTRKMFNAALCRVCGRINSRTRLKISAERSCTVSSIVKMVTWLHVLLCVFESNEKCRITGGMKAAALLAETASKRELSVFVYSSKVGRKPALYPRCRRKSIVRVLPVHLPLDCTGINRSCPNVPVLRR